MKNRRINFYCNGSLLFFCNINGTQLQSLPSKVEWPTHIYVKYDVVATPSVIQQPIHV